MLDLLQYCKTDCQKQYIREIHETGSIRQAAINLYVNERTIQRVVERVKRYRDNDRYADHLPSGHNIKGVSRLVNRVTGETQLEWIKTDKDKVDPAEAIRIAIANLQDDIPKYTPSNKLSVELSDELLNCFIITDYHIGAYAWGEETKGDNWNVDVAEQLLIDWFTCAIERAPLAHTAILANLGDFMHFDSLMAVTPTSGHILDADTRLQNIIRVVLRVIRRVVDMLLASHNKVIIVMAEGNHDIASSAWLREVLHMYYDQEDRIYVDTSPDPYYCIEHGTTSLFFHHGHKKRLANLDSVMAAKFRDVFGRTKHSFCHTGHYHHTNKIESNLMIVEQHRTLAAPDSHSSRGGWMSGRDASVITYSKEYGEVGRVIVSPEMASKTKLQD